MMTRKSRLKIFSVTINKSHESFKGYELNDGDETIVVSALNEKSAQKKALKLAYDMGGGYHRKIKGISRI